MAGDRRFENVTNAEQPVASRVYLIFSTFLLPLIVAATGGYAAFRIGLPGGWLVGSMFATILYALLGGQIWFPVPLRNVLFVGLGVVFGSAMTPETLSGIARWPLSMAVVLISVVLIVAASMIYFMHVAKWDRASAVLASVPGALSHVMSVAEEAGADVSRVAISQSMRIFLLAALVPMVIDTSAVTTVVNSKPIIAAVPLLIVSMAGTLGALIFQRFRIPGAMITGATLASAILFGSGYVSGVVHPGVILPGYVLLGMMIGARISGVPFALFRLHLAASAGGFAVVALTSAAVAAIVASVVDIPFGLAMLAFAPGAFEAMAALALSINYDPAFVVAHHMVRYFGIVLMTPLFLHLMSR